MDLSISNGIASSKHYDKRDDFNIEIDHFPFLMEPSYTVYIMQLIQS